MGALNLSGITGDIQVLRDTRGKALCFKPA